MDRPGAPGALVRPHALATPVSKIAIDLRPGGRWRAVIVDGDGGEHPLQGVYREVPRPERLVFTTGDPDNTSGEVASVVTVTLTDLGDTTEMRFRQAGYNAVPGIAAPERRPSGG